MAPKRRLSDTGKAKASTGDKKRATELITNKISATAREKEEGLKKEVTSSSSSSSSSSGPTPRYFLMKSEPEEFSIDDLSKKSQQTSCWEGIRNYQARNIMRDHMRVGDQAFFYHSSCKVPGIVGIVEIVKKAYPDHYQWDEKSKYYDAASSQENPRWLMVDVQLKKKLPEIVPLESLKSHIDGALKDMILLKRSRLSVQPVSYEEWIFIHETYIDKQKEE